MLLERIYAIYVCGYESWSHFVRRDQESEPIEWPPIREAFTLGFITQTNLEDDKQNKIYRLFMFYWILAIYSGVIIIIAIICNINPDSVTIPFLVEDIISSELELVKNITILNTVIDVLVVFILHAYFTT